jgi:hypothetical protein
MTGKIVISFQTAGPKADEQFIREYVLPAMERLPTLDSCDDVGFLRYGHDPKANHGEVRLHLSGDPEAIVRQEQDRWDKLVTDDLADSWESIEEDDEAKFGPTGAELSDRLTFLSSKMSKLAFEEFDADEFPSPVDTYPNEGPIPIGWWVLLHFLADQQAHSADEEIDTYVQGIRNRLFALGGFHGYDRADARIDDIIETLEETRHEVKEHLGKM